MSTLITLVCLASPSRAWAGVAPVIDSLSASTPTVVPGGLLTLTLLAHDPDCATGTCTSGCGAYIRADLTAWSADAGTLVAARNGTSASPYTASADWQAPAGVGVYVLQVSVADSGTSLCGGRNGTSGQLSVIVTTSTNQPPLVEAVLAWPLRLFPGQPATLKCLASDPESDPLTYTWSADGGTLTGDGEQVTFVGARPGVTTVTCTATDSSGASGSGSVSLALTDAFPETRLTQELAAPQRVALDAHGDVYVADPGRGAVVVLNLANGAHVYQLALPGVTSVAVDWQDRLLVGTVAGARVLARDGAPLLTLDPGEPLGAVADVAVDVVRQHYAVLHHAAARVVVYDGDGQRLAALGSTGDGPTEFRRPQGVAFTPQGDLVVADGGHAQVKVLGLDGTLHLAFGSAGSTPGKFVRLDDVDVDGDGVIYVSDAFQSWVQSFDPDGTLREVIGTYGDDVGRFKTPAGIAASSEERKLVVASLNTPSLEVFRLSGAAPPPRLPRPVLSASALAFPATPVGAASRAQEVTLSNAGTAPLGLRRVLTNGEFTQTHDCRPFLDPGQACSLRVAYAPETPGPAAGALALETNANPNVQTLALTGEAYVPALAHLTPGRVEFRGQRVGTASEPRTLSLINAGGRSLAVGGARVNGAFGLADGCRVVLAPGASCQLAVFFAPSTAGTIRGELAVDSDAANGTQIALLTGLALPPALEAEPARIDFGARPVASRGRVVPAVLRNKDDAPVVINAVEITGAPPFALLGDECSGRNLAAGQACALRLMFRPDAEGVFSASVRVASGGGDIQDVVALAGSGTSAGPREVIFSDDFESGDLSKWTVAAPAETLLRPGAARGDTALDFGGTPPGARQTRMLRVTNDGDVPLAVASVAIERPSEPGFGVAADGCGGALLPPGASCVVQLVFAPQGERPAVATLTILTSAGPESLTLTGAGRPASGKAR